MKAKKALKRLKRVESLLSDVLQYARGNAQILDLLKTGKTSVSSAKEAIDHPPQPSTAKRPLAHTGSDAPNHRTGSIRKAARAARKRGSAAKRSTGLTALVRKAVTKTAKRTVSQQAKPRRKQAVSKTKSSAVKMPVNRSGAARPPAETPMVHRAPTLPAASNPTVAGFVGKPAMSNSTATRGKQPDRSVESAPKQAVDAGGVGADPFRQA